MHSYLGTFNLLWAILFNSAFWELIKIVCCRVQYWIIQKPIFRAREALPASRLRIGIIDNLVLTFLLFLLCFFVGLRFRLLFLRLSFFDLWFLDLFFFLTLLFSSSESVDASFKNSYILKYSCVLKYTLKHSYTLFNKIVFNWLSSRG